MIDITVSGDENLKDDDLRESKDIKESLERDPVDVYTDMLK